MLQEFFAIIAAPFVGSFLGVVVKRLPAGNEIIADRSRCDHCGATLSLPDLVPILSWALARGHCRHCRAWLGWFYPAIELAAIGVAVSCSIAHSGDPLRFWLDCFLGWTLLAVAWIDVEHLVLPDILTLPLLLAGLAVVGWEEPDKLGDHALAAACGYLLFRGIAYCYRRLRGRDGLGEGDAKLLAAGGAWLGLLSLDALILVAAAIGLTGAAIAWLGGRRLDLATTVPFGAALALALFTLRLL